MITKGSQWRIHRRHSAQATAVSLAARFTVKNAVRAWAVLPGVKWPFESVDKFAGLLPFRPPAKIEQVQLDNCVAELVQARKA